MSQYFLGVDGGQSSTVALIANEQGKIVGRGLAGPCIQVSSAETEEHMAQVIRSCLHRACSAAAIPADSHFTAACLGFSGGKDDKERLIRSLIAAEIIKITHDAEIALIGATGGRPGIIVIAGTGSMAFGRNKDDQYARAGGWGFVFGDEGGAFDIARQALRSSLRFEEGWGPATALHAALLAETGCESASVVLHSFYGNQSSKDQLAQFARIVSIVANEGDQVAGEIIEAAAGALATYVEGVFRHLFSAEDDVTICPIGGVFASEAVRLRFAWEIKKRLNVAVRPALYTPAAGAVLAALQLGGANCVLEEECGTFK